MKRRCREWQAADLPSTLTVLRRACAQPLRVTRAVNITSALGTAIATLAVCAGLGLLPRPVQFFDGGNPVAAGGPPLRSVQG